MRLTDADALIQKLYEMKAKEEQYIGLENDVSVMIGSIGFEVMNMPTAYDIDKVVKKLEDEIKLYENSMSIMGGNDADIEYYGAMKGLGKAIEIVKGVR